jgi:uncharacterized membrane protein
MAKTSTKPRFVKKEAITFAFNIAKQNILFFLGIFVVWAFITIASSAIQGSINRSGSFLLSFLFSLVMWVINSIFSMGVINITLKFVDKKKPSLKDLYYTQKLFNYILASILRGLIILGGFILLIVPGIILAVKLQFAEYLVVDRKLNYDAALRGSWKMTKGVKWNLFLLGILLFLINLLGLLCLAVGLLVTVPLAMVAEAYVYRKLLSQTALK